MKSSKRRRNHGSHWEGNYFVREILNVIRDELGLTSAELYGESRMRIFLSKVRSLTDPILRKQSVKKGDGLVYWVELDDRLFVYHLNTGKLSVNEVKIADKSNVVELPLK